MTQADDDRRRRIEQILDALLALPEEERATALVKACGSDEQLRAELELLLARTADTFLGWPLDEVRAAMLRRAAGVVATQPVLEEGGRLGPFRIVRVIGEGGMGTVYLAERADEQYHRVVALKIMRRGLPADLHLDRFLRERQILASLEHPHIARLYEGDAADGVPYFAMEYVDGSPITAYCAKGHVGIESRLRLFLAACDAVRYAHQHLVIHRDLKPSNIFVSKDGVVKLLDFGIAKLIEGTDIDSAGPQAGHAALLDDEAGIMTPEYATPEQVARKPVTTATDVYALGTVLYELLAEERAHRIRHRTVEELRRVVCEVNPPPPSEHIRQRALRRRVAGDLDAIVLKAMRKEPAERYATPDALAEDVRRHLTGLPVLACASTVHYRAAKFARRHRKGVVVATALALLVLVGSTTTAWQARKAGQAAARAESVGEFLVGIFQSSDPDRTRGARVSVRELLDAGAARVEADLATQAELRDDMRLVLAEVFKQLGLFDRAQPLVERTLAARQERLGPRHADVAEALHASGELLYLSGQHDSAEARLNRALDMRRAVLGNEHADVALTLGHLSEVLRRKGELDEAEELARATLDMRQRVFGPEHPQVAMAMNQIGVILRGSGRTDDAAPYYEQAHAMLQRTRGEDHSDVLVARTNLAALQRARGQLAPAESLMADVLARYRRLYGDDHPGTITSMNNLAAIHAEQGEYDVAEQLFRTAIELWSARGEDDHQRAVGTESSLAVVLLETGNVEEAEQLFRSVLRSWTASLGPRHPNMSLAHGNLAVTLSELGRHAEAEVQLRTALEIAQETLVPEHPRIAGIKVNLAHALIERGRCQEMERDLRAIVTTPPPARLERERRVAAAHVVLGRCLVLRRQFAEAEHLLIAGYEMAVGPPRRERDLRRAAVALVSLYEATGRREMAAPYRAVIQ